MPKEIWKFVIPSSRDEYSNIDMPAGAEVLTAAGQQGAICV